MNSMANRSPFAASASCATRSAMNPGWDSPNPKYGYKGKNPLKSIMQVPNRTSLIFITTSANFGNMISMAAASLFLPFLPLLAKQILLNNFLSDIPAMGIAGDNVDPDWERTPHRWDIKLIRNFMITFG